jgi:hypothetical protein
MRILASANRLPARWRAGLAVALALFAAISGSCATGGVDRLMHDWQGHPMRELIATWGPPRYAYTDGAGGYVLLYVPDAESGSAAARPILRSGAQFAEQLVRRAAADPAPVYPPDMTAHWRVFRAFFVDATDKVYRSEWKGKWACCGT